MVQISNKTPAWDNMSPDHFRQEIIPQYRPAIFRQYVKNWPAIKKGKESCQALADYIKSFDHGHAVTTYVGAPTIKGRFFYQDDMQGINFERVSEKLSDSINKILSQVNEPNPMAVYTGSVTAPEHIPGFTAENKCDLAGNTAIARIWIGNSAVVPTHYDMLDNIVCVVSGRRRFTLFPPEQLPNLYVGPIDFTLSGQPISLVSLKDSLDIKKYPRFEEAIKHAEVAELEPGDALFIPKLWWHHVESLDQFNTIVNYWWDHSALGTESPFTTMMHGLISISHLPKPEREAWRAFFNHYIFRLEDDQNIAHIAPENRGVLGSMTPGLYKKIRSYVLSMLNRQD